MTIPAASSTRLTYRSTPVINFKDPLTLPYPRGVCGLSRRVRDDILDPRFVTWHLPYPEYTTKIILCNGGRIPAKTGT